MVSDNELIQSFKYGDQAAFEVFIHRYHNSLFGFLQRLLQDTQKAEDVTQEVFLSFMKQIRERKVPEHIRPWLYRVALNMCRDYWKSFNYQLEKSGLKQVPDRADPSMSVVEIVERDEVRKSIIRALDECTDIQRYIIILRFYQELKFHEISETLDIPLSTVKSHLYNGLKRLKKTMSVEKEGASYGQQI